MSVFAKCAAVLAALGVLAVLITPAPDELPCTGIHKVPVVNSLAAAFDFPVLQLTFLNAVLSYGTRALSRMDVLFLTCTFLR